MITIIDVLKPDYAINVPTTRPTWASIKCEAPNMNGDINLSGKHTPNKNPESLQAWFGTTELKFIAEPPHPPVPVEIEIPHFGGRHGTTKPPK
jgi:hypothetical protein